MKRHPSLAPLSRDHHQALILAQLLKTDNPGYKGLPTGSKEKGQYAIEFFHQHLIKHFAEEEAVINKIRGVQIEMDQMGEQLIHEHLELNELFGQIDNCSDLISHLNIIGQKLELHIRKEERVFFPMIQQYCSEKMLEEIETLVSE